MSNEAPIAIEKTNIRLIAMHIRVYDYVEKFVKKNRYSPYTIDIAKAVGVSEGYALKIINQLVDMGFFVKIPRIRRGIAIGKPLVVQQHQQQTN